MANEYMQQMHRVAQAKRHVRYLATIKANIEANPGGFSEDYSKEIADAHMRAEGMRDGLMDGLKAMGHVAPPMPQRDARGHFLKAGANAAA